MSEELRQPAVVDLDALLQPIPGENPSGENLRYSGLYDQISEARRADEDLAQGAWQTELKVADYREVLNLAVPALSTQSKDLQVAVWLAEALVKQNGFVGLRDSLSLLAGFHDKFWETLHPEIDEGDMEGRANAISWFDTQLGLAIKKAPYTGAEGYGYQDWEDSRIFDVPDDVSGLPEADQKRLTALREQAEKEKRVTADLWRKEYAATRRAPVEQVNFTIEECWTVLADLNRLIEEKYDRNQTPGLSTFRKSLDDVHTQVKKLLEEKRIEEPDPVEEEDIDTAEAGSNGAVPGKGTAGTGGPISNRRDALKRLGEIAEFFHRTEPHSPVSYLVQRAVKWGNMPLETWLQDVIKDDTIISQIKQTLGFNTLTGGDSTGNT
jgi:type VI secretion system protein ImpA